MKKIIRIVGFMALVLGFIFNIGASKVEAQNVTTTSNSILNGVCIALKTPKTIKIAEGKVVIGGKEYTYSGMPDGGIPAGATYPLYIKYLNMQYFDGVYSPLPGEGKDGPDSIKIGSVTTGKDGMIYEIRNVSPWCENYSYDIAQSVRPPVVSTTTSTIGDCYTFTKDLKLGDRGSDVDNLVKVLVKDGIIMNPNNENILGEDFNQSVLNSVKVYQKKYGIPQTGFVGPITRGSLNVKYGCKGLNPTIVIPPFICPAGYTCTIPATTSTSTIRLNAKDIGSTASQSYQINLSFEGGTNSRPVRSWILDIPCPVNVEVVTVPGGACGKFTMEPFQGNGNVLDNDFYFKNSSGINQTITLTLSGYDSSRSLIGSSKAIVHIPANVSGQISWSQVTLLSPNGGQTFRAGDQVQVNWTTKEGLFNLQRDSRTEIMVVKGNATVLYLKDVINDGSEVITLPSTLVAGNDYKISVSVYSIKPEGGQMDESDSTFTVTSAYSTSQPSVSASLISANYDQVGAWKNFSYGAGNLNKNPNDWNWGASIYLPQQKTISRITIKHNIGGEVWSTGYSRYLRDGTDLYGYEEHPYPLVVGKDGKQVNTESEQNILTGSGSYYLNLYGQPESNRFNGGKIIVEFSDGTSVTSNIPSSNINQGSNNASLTPAPTITPSSEAKPTISYINPVYAFEGNSVTIYGSGFNRNMVVNLNGKTVDEFIKPTSVSSDGKNITFIVPRNVVPSNLTSGIYSIMVFEYEKMYSNRVSLTVVSTRVYTSPTSTPTPSPIYSPVSTYRPTVTTYPSPTYQAVPSPIYTATPSPVYSPSPTYNPSPTANPKITAFWAKEVNPSTKSVTLLWQTSSPVSVYINFGCTPGSISLRTDKGNSPLCEKGGLWAWQNQTSDGIVVTASNNTQAVNVPFTMSIIKDGQIIEEKTLSVTFPASVTSPSSSPTATNQSSAVQNSVGSTLWKSFTNMLGF